MPGDALDHDLPSTTQGETTFWTLSEAVLIPGSAPFHAVRHRAGIVNAKGIVRPIDKHIEMREEVLTQKTVNPKPYSLDAFHVVDKNALISGNVIANLERIDLRKHSGSPETHSSDFRLFACCDMKIGSKCVIDDRHLRTGVYKEVVRLRVIDRHSHDHLMAIEVVYRNRLDPSGTSRLGRQRCGDYGRKK
jgi:hypothetical protein